jgi:dnd system-associated protein 4
MVNDVKRPHKYEAMLFDLCQKDKDKNKNIFLTYKDALVFAACLGFKSNKRVPFDKSSEPVGIHIFKGEYDSVIFNYIGIASTESSDIIGEKREEEKIKIFEEYACGGLELIENQIYKKPGDWRESLLELVLEENDDSNQSILDDITNLVR